MGQTSSKEPEIILKGNGLHHEYFRCIFVLDVSGSMSGWRSQLVNDKLRQRIDEIVDNSYVGIVSFNESSKVCHKMINVSNRTVRDQLIGAIPTLIDGGTDIGSGILQGIKALVDENISTDGAIMYLLTDGQHNCGPAYVPRVLSLLIQAKIKVMAVSIGNDTDDDLEFITSQTGGQVFQASGENREMAALVINTAIQELDSNKAIAESVDITVCEEIVELNNDRTVKKINIDSDIGRDAIFSIGIENIDNILVKIVSPNGETYESASGCISMNYSQKKFHWKTNSAEKGVWSIILIRKPKQHIQATISVKCQPINLNAIELKVGLKEANSKNPPIIYANLRNGSDYVVGAEVIATITKPDDTKSQLKLINYNNTYCNYFTDYGGAGRYNVSVFAHNKGSNCNYKTENSIRSSAVPQFERQVITGCFKITEQMPKKPFQRLQDIITNLTLNYGDQSVDTPVQRNVRAIIRIDENKTTLNYERINQMRDLINEITFLVEKSIISDIEKNVYNKKLKVMKNKCSSFVSDEQFDNCQGQLNEIKEKISQ